MNSRIRHILRGKREPFRISTPVHLGGGRSTRPSKRVCAEYTYQFHNRAFGVVKVRGSQMTSDSVRLEDAINRLAAHVENGALLAATNPVAFLDAVEAKLAAVRVLIEWVREKRSKGLDWRADDVLHHMLSELRELGLLSD